MRTQSHEIDEEEEEGGEEGEVSEGEETVSVGGGEGIRETVERGRIPEWSGQQFHLNANSSTLMTLIIMSSGVLQEVPSLS